MVRQISALSERVASRSSGFSRDSSSNRSSIPGTSAMIRRKASVVTQNPSGTAMPFDPRQRRQVRALAANDRDVLLADLGKVNTYCSLIAIPPGKAYSAALHCS
jgi:hypothetical protein